MAASHVVPFIDSHCHTQGLPFDAWELIGATGCTAMVISAGNPHVFQEEHIEMPDLADIRRYWEGPILLAPVAEKKHFIKVFVAVGISFMTKWRDWEKATELLAEFVRRPNVVAVGETGIDPWQYWFKFPLEEQKVALAEQVRVAKDAGIPLILHTPTQRKGCLPEVPPDQFKRVFLDQDLEIVNRIGLPHDKLVIDHVDDTILEYVLRETEAYVGIGVGDYARRTNPGFFVDVVERYGPERLMINSDYYAGSSLDLMSIPAAIRGMRRRLIDEATIQRVVFDNANDFYALGLT